MLLKQESFKSFLHKKVGKKIPSKNPYALNWLYTARTPPHTRLKNEISIEEPLKNDLWSFGKLWPEIAAKLRTVRNLYAAIEERRKQILETKEKHRHLTEQNLLLSSTQISLAPEGYLLDGKFLVKPMDEAPGCLNNRDGLASPLENRYDSHLRDTLAYEISDALGMDLVPKTFLAILSSEQFYDAADGVSLKEMGRWNKTCKSSDKEKLCAVQEFVPNTKRLQDAVQELKSAGLSDEEITARFDASDLEDATILSQLFGGAAFRVYPKGADSIGNEIFGLKMSLSNDADNLFSKPLSKQKIDALQPQRLIQFYIRFGLENEIPHLCERISSLKAAVC